MPISHGSIQHQRLGMVTGAWILGHIVVEVSQHVGQVELIRGMLRGAGSQVPLFEREPMYPR